MSQTREIVLDNSLQLYDNCFNSGVRYYNQNNYNQAVVELSKAISMDPERSPAYAYRGMAYYKQHKYSCAIHDIDLYIELVSRHKESESLLARVYYYRACMHLDKFNSEPLYVEGLGEAIWGLLKSAELDPDLEEGPKLYHPNKKLNAIIASLSKSILFKNINELPDDKQVYLKEKLAIRGVVEAEAEGLDFTNKFMKFYQGIFYNNSTPKMVELQNMVDTDLQQMGMSER